MKVPAYTIQLRAQCVHCGESLAEPFTATRELMALEAFMQWTVARACDCILAEASALPHVQLGVAISFREIEAGK